MFDRVKVLFKQSSQQKKHNPRLNIMERQEPEMHLLHDFEKPEIKGESLTTHFESRQKATIRPQFYSPALLQEVKNYIEEAAKYCK